MTSVSSTSPTGLVTYHANGLNQCHGILEGLERCAEKLRQPFSSYWGRDVVHLMQGHLRDQDPIYGLFWVGAFIIKFIALGILWGMGTMLASLMHFGRKNFTFCHPEKQIVPLNTNRIKILTYNACLGPEWMVAANKLRPASERIHEVADAIKKSDCDIACLQEVFDEGAAEILKEKLRAQGFSYFIYNAAPGVLKLNSGLFVASKYPLKDPVFWKFSEKSGWDRFSGKGALAVTVQITASIQFALFNTHFNGPAKNEAHARKTQMQQFLTHIEEYVEKHDDLNERFVGCGDFNESNLSDLSEERKDLYCDVPVINERGTLFDVDHDPAIGRDMKHVHNWKVIPNPIDHMIMSSHTESLKPSCFPYVSRMGGASDHLGIIGSFIIDGKSECSPKIDRAEERAVKT